MTPYREEIKAEASKLNAVGDLLRQCHADGDGLALLSDIIRESARHLEGILHDDWKSDISAMHDQMGEPEEGEEIVRRAEARRRCNETPPP